REGFAGIADGAPDRNGFYTSKIAVPGSVMNIVKPRESHQTRLAYVQDRKTAELHLDFVLNRLRDAFPNIKIRPPDPNYPKYDRLLKNIVLDEGNPPVTMWLSLTTNGSEYQVEFGVYVPEPAR